MTTPKDDLKELMSESTEASAAASSGLLAGFTASEQLAILYQTENKPTPESVRAIPEREWRKMRNIGDRFIVKLIQRGWLGQTENRVRREAMSEKERHKRANAARLKKLNGMIQRANRQIKGWEREAARLASEQAAIRNECRLARTIHNEHNATLDRFRTRSDASRAALSFRIVSGHRTHYSRPTTAKPRDDMHHTS